MEAVLINLKNNKNRDRTKANYLEYLAVIQQFCDQTGFKTKVMGG